jgi:hypothetical protein
MPNGNSIWAIYQNRKLIRLYILVDRVNFAFKFAGLWICPLFFSLYASIISSMSQSFKLFRLQQIDTQIDKVKTRLREIEIELQEDSELQQANQRLEQARQFMHETEKALHRSEEEVLAQRIKIEETEAVLYGGKVRNPKELQDLQLESASLKRYQSVLEDRELDIMVAMEQAEADVQAALSKQQAALSKYESKNTTLSKEKAGLLEDVAHEEDERRATAEGIPTADLQIYEQLRQQRRGVAVARVIDRTCGACGSTLNTGLLSAAHATNQLTRCDTCGRILYVA